MTVMPPALDERVLELLRGEFAARAAGYDRSGTFAHENIEALRAAGLLGLVVPTAQGGAGRGLVAAATVVGSIARGDASTALVLAMQYIHTASVARTTHWPRNARARILDAAAREGALINALRVEPALGSPARGGLPDTVAEWLPRNAWRLRGHKIYATGVPALSWLLVWVRVHADSGPLVGIILVPASAPGVSIVETWNHGGMRGTASHDVILDKVELPAHHAVDFRSPQEWKPEASQAAWNAVLIAAVYDGVARAARDWFVRWLKERAPSNLAAPLATLPRFQEAVGEIDALLLVNQRLIEDAARRADHDENAVPATETGLLKHLVTANAIAAVEIAVKLSGNAGLSRANPLERHYRDVLCSRIHTPQSDSILTAAGRAALV